MFYNAYQAGIWDTTPSFETLPPKFRRDCSYANWSIILIYSKGVSLFPVQIFHSAHLWSFEIIPSFNMLSLKKQIAAVFLHFSEPFTYLGTIWPPLLVQFHGATVPAGLLFLQSDACVFRFLLTVDIHVTMLFSCYSPQRRQNANVNI